MTMQSPRLVPGDGRVRRTVCGTRASHGAPGEREPAWGPQPCGCRQEKASRVGAELEWGLLHPECDSAVEAEALIGNPDGSGKGFLGFRLEGQQQQQLLPLELQRQQYQLEWQLMQQRQRLLPHEHLQEPHQHHHRQQQQLQEALSCPPRSLMDLYPSPQRLAALASNADSGTQFDEPWTVSTSFDTPVGCEAHRKHSPPHMSGHLESLSFTSDAEGPAAVPGARIFYGNGAKQSLCNSTGGCCCLSLPPLHLPPPHAAALLEGPGAHCLGQPLSVETSAEEDTGEGQGAPRKSGNNSNSEGKSRSRGLLNPPAGALQDGGSHKATGSRCLTVERKTDSVGSLNSTVSPGDLLLSSRSPTASLACQSAEQVPEQKLDGAGGSGGQTEGAVDEKKKRRLLLNRASAKRSRQRRQGRLEELEAITKKLRQDQEHLQQKLAQAVEELKTVEQCNEDLRRRAAEVKALSQGRVDKGTACAQGTLGGHQAGQVVLPAAAAATECKGHLEGQAEPEAPMLFLECPDIFPGCLDLSLLTED